jgi:hypothetical protein
VADSFTPSQACLIVSIAAQTRDCRKEVIIMFPLPLKGYSRSLCDWALSLQRRHLLPKAIFALTIVLAKISADSASQPTSRDSSEAGMSRDDIFKHLISAVRLDPVVLTALSSSKQASILAEVDSDIRKYGGTLLPGHLEGISADGASDIIDAPLVLMSSDTHYVELATERRIWQVKLLMIYRQMVGNVDDTAISRMIDRYLNGVKDSMLKHLATDEHLIPEVEVVEAVDRMRELFVRHEKLIGSIYLKKPLTDAEVDTLIHEFDERLKSSMVRARSLLSDADKQTDQLKAATAIEDARGRILVEITNPTIRVLLNRTMDKSRQVELPKSATSEYDGISHELLEAEAHLRAKPSGVRNEPAIAKP